MSRFTFRLEGIVLRNEYFLNAYNNKWVLSEYALIVLTFFVY